MARQFKRFLKFSLAHQLENRNLSFYLNFGDQRKFCCDDGVCIDSEYACDMSKHCPGKQRNPKIMEIRL